MPNWCFNRLVVSGKQPDQAMAPYITQEGDGDPYLDFEKIAPTPQELLFHTGYATIDGQPYKAWREMETDATTGQVTRKDVGIGEAELQALTEKYGAPDWYRWRLDNWGCKWSAGSCHIHGGKRSWKCEFDTPWAPPIELIQKLSSLLGPDYTVTLDFVEEGMCFRGWRRYVNGEETGCGDDNSRRAARGRFMRH